MAWQFDRPEAGVGFLQAFRREKCIFEMGRLQLHGLDPEGQYEVTDLDDPGAPRLISGREITLRGLAVTIAEAPGSALITYRKVDPRPGAAGR